MLKRDSGQPGVGLWAMSVTGDADEYLLVVRFLHFGVFLLRVVLHIVRRCEFARTERGHSCNRCRTFCSSILRQLSDRCSRHFLACKQPRSWLPGFQPSKRVRHLFRATLLHALLCPTFDLRWAATNQARPGLPAGKTSKDGVTNLPTKFFQFFPGLLERLDLLLQTTTALAIAYGRECASGQVCDWVGKAPTVCTLSSTSSSDWKAVFSASTIASASSAGRWRK